MKTLDEIRERLVSAYDPDRIILFGSRAHGQGEEESDFDLLILKDTAARIIDRQIEVETILQDSAVPLDILAACYHSQQSVEQGLKALIIEKGEKSGKAHDIVELLGHAKRLGWRIALAMDDAIFLNSIYKGRYPAEEGLLPRGEPSKDDAERALNTAKAFLDGAKAALMA